LVEFDDQPDITLFTPRIRFHPASKNGISQSQELWTGWRQAFQIWYFEMTCYVFESLTFGGKQCLLTAQVDYHKCELLMKNW